MTLRRARPSHISTHSAQVTVLQIIRAWIQTGIREAELTDAPLEFARVQRIDGLLYHIGGCLGESKTAPLERIWKQNTAKYLNLIAAVRPLITSLDDEVVWLKGADYIENLYGDPGARQMADLDLLISPRALKELAAQLSAGYKIRTRTQTELGVEIAGGLIEFHAQIGLRAQSTIDPAHILRRSVQRRINGYDYLFPTDLDRLLIWLTNQSKAAFIDGLWAYVDLALILKRLLKHPNGHPWEDVKAHIHHAHLTAAFQLALLRLEEYGIWPFESLPVSSKRADRWRLSLTEASTPERLAPPWKRQALVLALTRRGMIPTTALGVLGKAIRR